MSLANANEQLEPDPKVNVPQLEKLNRVELAEYFVRVPGLFEFVVLFGSL